MPNYVIRMGFYFIFTDQLKYAYLNYKALENIKLEIKFTNQLQYQL